MCVHSSKECLPDEPDAADAKSRRKRSARGDAASSSKAPEPPPVGALALRGSSAAEASQSPPVDYISPPTSNASTSVTQQFGANRSAISLAVNVYESLGNSSTLLTPSVLGDEHGATLAGSPWKLQTMHMPPRSVMEMLVDLYFERMHWFISICYKPSFIKQSHELLDFAVWKREDKGKVLATLIVAAIGLKCAMQDATASGQQLLAQISASPQQLADQLVSETRLHLLDLFEDICLETVQVCSLLGTYYIFHGSPSLAWPVLGLSVRAAYALALHCDDDSGDQATVQARRRCWNHVTVADTFASQVYGRPASIDPAFSSILPLENMDDDIMVHLSSHYREQFPTGSTFHILKYRLYDIIKGALTRFRVLRLQNPISVEDLRSLVTVVQHIDTLLRQFKESLPTFYDYELWQDDGRCFFDERDTAEDPQAAGRLRHLQMQAQILQLTYYAAMILAHRPLLEFKISPQHREGVSQSLLESVSKSYDISVHAALRISQAPITNLQYDFCISFALIHSFTAGVILCIPLTSHPFSYTAQEARGGVLRIIEACGSMKHHSQIATHAEQLLTDLLRLSLRREIDIYLGGTQRANALLHPGQQASEMAGFKPTDNQLPIATTGESTSHGNGGGSGSAKSPNERAQHLNGYPGPHITGPNESQSSGEWIGPYLSDQSAMPGRQQLDSQLSETFGAFGESSYQP